MVLNEILVHFVCNIFVCTCSVVGEIVAFMSPIMRGVQFVFIYNGCYLCLHLKAGGLCFWATRRPISANN